MQFVFTLIITSLLRQHGILTWNLFLLGGETYDHLTLNKNYNKFRYHITYKSHILGKI